jgi:hypothetical protein
MRFQTLDLRQAVENSGEDRIHICSACQHLISNLIVDYLHGVAQAQRNPLTTSVSLCSFEASNSISAEPKFIYPILGNDRIPLDPMSKQKTITESG